MSAPVETKLGKWEKFFAKKLVESSREREFLGTYLLRQCNRSIFVNELIKQINRQSYPAAKNEGYLLTVGNKMPRNKKPKVNKQLRAAAAEIEIEIDYGRLKAANTKYFSSPFAQLQCSAVQS